MAKETREQGYADAIGRLMGSVAENPTIEYLEGFLEAARKVLIQVEDRRVKLINMDAMREAEEARILESIGYMHGEVLESLSINAKLMLKEEKIAYLVENIGIERKYAEKLV